MDSQYRKIAFTLSERKHRYGPGVHLINDPYLITRLARLSSPECVQPETNRLIRDIYRSLGAYLANHVFPRATLRLPTRMAEQHPKEAIFEGEAIAPDTKVVIVDLARAGMMPSVELFDLFTAVLNQASVRVDHVFINRETDKDHRVTGAPIHGTKIGGPLDDAIVVVPDPMGATGSSLLNVMEHYEKHVKGKARCWISLNLIVTPEYVLRIKKEHPDFTILTLRLDRGFSAPKALDSLPGEFPAEEKGLNKQDYIVPGAGGFGEISNNSFV
ncbi:MAG: uracil phosphoribosyltransferase [Pseudomonadota bacterium]